MSINNRQSKKENISPPGKYLSQLLEEIGMKQKELADRMGRPLKTINEIIKGKSPITVSTAIQLEKIFNKIDSSIWLELERNYRDELAKNQEQEQLENDYKWLENFPLPKMKEFGWIELTKSKAAKVKSMLKFFSIASAKQWEDIYVKDIPLSSFRISPAFAKNAGAITAWLRQGEIDAMKVDNHIEFSRRNFKLALSEIKTLAYNHPIDFAEQLKSICGKVGVTIIYTPQLPKAPINGAARWIYDKPVIQLTDYRKRNDIFWFTFFHEAGHIILQGKKDKHLKYNVKEDEDEVDEFANKWLVNEDIFNEIISKVEITDQIILEISEKHELHPGIIVGHLQYKGIIEYSKFNDHKEKIDLFTSV